MQNTPQTFRGAGAPGVNFSEHSYDNHIGAHCQPSGYQPYPNQPYHPLPSPRAAHHYGNHQMQQNMPYRHHGGAYAPNQNQYGSNMNQDMYRNHSGYPVPNNRNMSSKPWTENNSPNEMMNPYGQVPHSQMMNNPPSQMPVSTMRSPPHATSNMNPVPPQGQQHFRQMQSPAHSPHSWSQAQIPSPGVMHSSRTTPSPLPAHVRSPGHSQPFSPPPAHPMNMPPHQQPPPPENGQIPQSMNSPSNNDPQNPANPLHSLQKMVMIDPEPKVMMPMMGEANEQYANHCGPQNYVPEEHVNTESNKDPAYSTYYNMDENRFESKPSGSNSNYSAVPQVSNCNYPVPPQINCEEVQNNPVLPNNSPSVSECLQSDQNLMTSQMKSSTPTVVHSQINPIATQSDSASNLSECPPHAESAPIFTDQTKAAVSTNSEQALESKSNQIAKSDTNVTQPEEASNSDSEKLESSVLDNRISKDTTECSDENNIQNVPSNSSCSSENELSIKSPNESEKLEESSDSSVPETVGLDSDLSKSETSESQNSLSIKSTTEIHNEDGSAIEADITVKEEISSDSDAKIKSPNVVKDVKGPFRKCDISSSSNNPLTKPHPVKVLIHRIRKDDSNDTWHVPGGNFGSSETCINVVESERKPDCRPQIVMLSSSSSDKKSNSSDKTPIITIKEEIDEERTQNFQSNDCKPIKITITRSPDKKRGRPAGSKNKIKPGVVKKKGRRGKKKKFDPKLRNSDAVLPKIKKGKIFNGPYVHLTGSRENPSSILVVNVAQKEEEKLKISSSKRSFASTTAGRIKKKQVGHLSTLSPTYDAFNKDKTWLCIFCHKGSHHGGLGDLYGPYYIKDKNYGSTKPSGTNTARGKKRKSEHEEKPSKRSKTSLDITPVRNMDNDSSDPDSNLKETWIHEDCAVWCQSISLMGEEVQGLEEAVTEAYENTCCQCSLTGATLGCWGKGCKELYHYRCAKETGCQMDIEKFSLLCPKHQ